ncbi:glycosyltransferase [Hymenobacter lutimineralis]|uniref:Glycosyltransferase n=1 Tax=Hymenobacter lutimineralis TaxID=2606448 RepID=A0A5D6V4H6_9BACT|nr:glycosyltransferase [Hymenobacter lutimineralis]TYZ10921.1 glycosyltransferase [Hymenobacter lutimineralis]
MMLTAALLCFVALWFAMLGTATVLFARRHEPRAAPVPQPLPRVSILLAARNEEVAIERCLASIRELAYPAPLLEVLLGDDASTDNTVAIAQAVMQDYAGSFRVVSIQTNKGQARGKANVLAHLARAATSDVFCITDADIAVPRTWVSGLLGRVQGSVGIVTGITVVQGPRLFDQLQRLDWLLSLSLVQVVSDWGKPVTAMGNNMLVTRQAYEATGGYEALPFSVTEDYALFRAVLGRGFTFRNVFSPEVLAESLPIGTLGQLLHQRRRWLRGVEALPWGLQAALLVYSGIYPAMLGLAFTSGPLAALAVLGAKMVAQGVLTALCFYRVGLRPPLRLLPLFELYTVGLTLGLVGFRVLPLRFTWKGRQYA